MNKLTAERCRDRIASLKRNRRVFGLAMDSEIYLQALEIALPVLEQRSGWISCSDRMPDADSTKRVCVYTPSEHADLMFRFVPASLFRQICSEATHWQYMVPPQPSTTPQIDNDGWIEWGGGKRPVGYHAPVRIRYFDGEESEAFAGHIHWEHCGDGDDIIAYRVVQQERERGEE